MRYHLFSGFVIGQGYRCQPSLGFVLRVVFCLCQCSGVKGDIALCGVFLSIVHGWVAVFARPIAIQFGNCLASLPLLIAEVCP